MFDQVRCDKNQNIDVQKIELDLFTKNDFDYEENKGTVYTIDDYKQMLKQEIKLFKKEWLKFCKKGLSSITTILNIFYLHDL